MAYNSESPVGNYWGPATATIDWCEDNYIITSYVAEFFNSTTSFCIVAAGLLPLLLHKGLWSVMEWRFVLAFLSVCVVGLGSVAFHGTLQFRHQMWDEVPMLWTVVIILYCLLEHEHSSPRYGPLLPLSLAVYAGFSTCATSQQDGSAQWFSFHTLFAACEFPALYMVYKFFRGLSQSETTLRSVMKRGFAAYALAIPVWLSDLNFCGAFQKLPGYSYWNLHAFGWHTLTSYGLYTMLVGIWYHRLRCVLGHKVSIRGGTFPLLTFEKES